MDISGNTTIPSQRIECIVISKNDRKDIRRLLNKAKEDNDKNKVRIFGEMLYTGMFVIDKEVEYKKDYIDKLCQYDIKQIILSKLLECSKNDKRINNLREKCIDNDMYYNRDVQNKILVTSPCKVIKLKRKSKKLMDMSLAWQYCHENDELQEKYQNVPKPMPEDDYKGHNGFDRVCDLAYNKSCEYNEEVANFLKEHGVKYEEDKVESYQSLITNAVTKALCELVIWLKRVRRIVSYSGGKDSTAMLIKLIEEGVKIDQIVFANTGVELPGMIEYIKRVERYIGRKIDIVEGDITFDDWFYGINTKGKNKGQRRGFPPTVGVGCWAKRELKIKPLRKIEGKDNIIYLGIAADERHRMYREQYQHKNLYKFPLIEWDMTEQECIDFLKERDLHNPLYDIFSRLGCWMCPKQPLHALKTLHEKYPEYWAKLKQYEKDSPHGFKCGYELEELEERFKREVS